MSAVRRSLAIVVILVTFAGPVGGQTWVSQGPGPIQNGGVEGIVNGEVTGAIQAIATHPSDPATVYVGAVNGGIWRTDDATAPTPTWTPQTDAAASLSIGALAFDPTDPTAQTLLAGIGRFSSMRAGGDRTGLLRTSNGGTTWTPIDGGLRGKNVTGVAARGDTLIVSIDRADDNLCASIGIFRSTNGGISFDQLNATTGVPRGGAFDLAADPTSPDTLYTAIRFAGVCNNDVQSPPPNGVYKSIDSGATWSKVSSPAMDALLSDQVTNVKIAVGSSDNLYAGIIADTGELAAVFRSGGGGTIWAAMDLPGTIETTGFVGIHPDASGDLHFSIAADPSNANVVYVGGDHQPLPVRPNSIGAMDFSGRLFRGDASLPSGSQWGHLTHSNLLGPAGGGTASNSAPHADSRRLAFDSNGRLLEADDGGIYVRTSPRLDTGDWFSLNGDLQLTELHDIAYDTLSNVIMGGTQDNGVVEQTTPGGTTWQIPVISVRGDGGDVAVDATSFPGESIRYSSAQNFDNFNREVYDPGSNLRARRFVTPIVVGGGATLVPQFVTPLVLNAIDPKRLVIVGDNSIYESLDQGNTITEIGPGQGPNTSPFFNAQNAVAYGGRRSGVDNADVLYVGSNDQLLVRMAGGGALNAAVSPGGLVRDVVLDPADWQKAYVVTDQVFRSGDAGASWTNITANLVTLGAHDFRTLQYIPSPTGDRLVVGTGSGVFVSNAGDGFESWAKLGAGLPNILVYDLDYDATDNVLVAATVGRGAWTLSGVAATTTTTTLPVEEICGNCVDDDGDGLMDFESPECCGNEAPLGLIVQKAQIQPKKSGRSGLRLTSKPAIRLTTPLIPQDVTLQIRASGSAQGFCAVFPASELKVKKQTLLLKHPKRPPSSAQGITAFSVRLQKTGEVLIRINGNHTKLPAPAAGPVHITWAFAGPTLQCSTSQATLHGGHRGRLSFP